MSESSNLPKPAMRFYFDTEFMDGEHSLDLLSIGVVCQHGEEFYGVAGWADHERANDWVREHVLPQLDTVPDGNAYYPAETYATQSELAEAIAGFVQEQCGDSHRPEFWGYYSAYDWLLLCKLLGGFLSLPDSWPQFCIDFKQWCHTRSVQYEILPVQGDDKHHALADARWIQEAHEACLKQTEPGQQLRLLSQRTSFEVDGFWCDLSARRYILEPSRPGQPYRLVLELNEGADTVLRDTPVRVSAPEGWEALVRATDNLAVLTGKLTELMVEPTVPAETLQAINLGSPKPQRWLYMVTLSVKGFEFFWSDGTKSATARTKLSEVLALENEQLFKALFRSYLHGLARGRGVDDSLGASAWLEALEHCIPSSYER